MHVLLRVETGLRTTVFFFFDLIWQLHTTGSGWASSMELMEEATKHPGPPLERTHMAVSNHHFFPHRIYRILLDSLDNANTCRDAVSVVKQVSTFAVWNHKRHYVRLTNQQGSIKKVFAVKEVQQKTTTSKWFPHEQMGLQKMQTLIENYVHMISSSAKKNETNAILLFDCWTQDRNIEYEQDIYYCILEKYCGGLWKLLQIVNSIRWLGEVK